MNEFYQVKSVFELEINDRLNELKKNHEKACFDCYSFQSEIQSIVRDSQEFRKAEKEFSGIKKFLPTGVKVFFGNRLDNGLYSYPPSPSFLWHDGKNWKTEVKSIRIPFASEIKDDKQSFAVRGELRLKFSGEFKKNALAWIERLNTASKCSEQMRKLLSLKENIDNVVNAFLLQTNNPELYNAAKLHIDSLIAIA